MNQTVVLNIKKIHTMPLCPDPKVSLSVKRESVNNIYVAVLILLIKGDGIYSLYFLPGTPAESQIGVHEIEFIAYFDTFQTAQTGVIIIVPQHQ